MSFCQLFGFLKSAFLKTGPSEASLLKMSPLKKKLLYIILSAVFVAFPVQAKTYVFVSHSLKDTALKAYFKEAQALGATLVVRGLVEDSFMATKKKIDDVQISYEINPPLFDHYDVTVVPTIVRDEGGRIQKISGHIPLKTALEIFDDEE